MSLELTIENLRVAINTLTEAINHQGSHAFIPRATTPVVKDAVANAVAAAVAAAPVVVAPVMPAAPTFEIPQTITQIPQNGAPFTDPKGLIEFVMTSYKNLGPAKGAGIQGVLTGLGYQNINDVKAEHYAALFCGIEALK